MQSHPGGRYKIIRMHYLCPHFLIFSELQRTPIEPHGTTRADGENLAARSDDVVVCDCHRLDEKLAHRMQSDSGGEAVMMEGIIGDLVSKILRINVNR